MNWGIAETASEIEKIKSESDDYLIWLNSCGVLDRNDPEAEWVEIVRCKDCKWKNKHNCTRAVELFIDDDKYCAWAERR